jgi:hypothetical protein
MLCKRSKNERCGSLCLCAGCTHSGCVQIYVLDSEGEHERLRTCSACFRMQNWYGMRLTHRGERPDARLEALAIQPRLLVVVPAARADQRLRHATWRRSEHVQRIQRMYMMQCIQQQVRHDSTMLGRAAASAVDPWRNQTGLCTVASCSRRWTWSSTMLLWSKPPRSGEVLYPRSSAMDGSLQAGRRSSRSSTAECMRFEHLCSDVQQGSQQPCAQWPHQGEAQRTSTPCEHCTLGTLDCRILWFLQRRAVATVSNEVVSLVG